MSTWIIAWEAIVWQDQWLVQDQELVLLGEAPFILKVLAILFLFSLARTSMELWKQVRWIKFQEIFFNLVFLMMFYQLVRTVIAAVTRMEIPWQKTREKAELKIKCRKKETREIKRNNYFGIRIVKEELLIQISNVVMMQKKNVSYFDLCNLKISFRFLYI